MWIGYWPSIQMVLFIHIPSEISSLQISFHLYTSTASSVSNFTISGSDLRVGLNTIAMTFTSVSGAVRTFSFRVTKIGQLVSIKTVSHSLCALSWAQSWLAFAALTANFCSFIYPYSPEIVCWFQGLIVPYVWVTPEISTTAHIFILEIVQNTLARNLFIMPNVSTT